MKLCFTSFDVQATVAELQKSIVGLRVNQIYDVDHKTYLIKLQKPDHKAVLVLESAARLHTTEYQWPKSPAPSGFSMKLRKHLRNKRLESIRQLGMDRVVEMIFGSGVAQHHLIVELYDRGNITLTDADYTILIILRPRKDGEDTRFAAHERYPIDTFRAARAPPTLADITAAMEKAKPSTNLKKLLNPLLDSGSGWVVHELTLAGLSESTVKDVCSDPAKIALLQQAAARAQQHMTETHDSKGYVIQRRQERPSLDGSPPSQVLLNQEFHPVLYAHHKDSPHLQYDTFNTAVDEFFQSIESQRLEQKEVQKEKEAFKKLDNVRRDHTNRMQALQALQDQDTQRGQLIELNNDLVEAAITQVRAALAHQTDWRLIQEMLEEAQERGDPVALAMKTLSLPTNTIVMMLSDPYNFEEDDCLLDSDEEREEGTESNKLRPTTVDIDIDLSAHANARKYYTSRRKAGVKAEKTIAASAAAIKSATRKAKQQLKEVQTSSSINKQRKVHWFEKFLWFISSENYLVLAGHDQQQNEVLVKKHMKPNDVYVHADLHGASSVILKNPTGGTAPPATLLQAGSMALCNSRAWQEKIVTSAWWVWGHQVSKSAPTGEYLTTGSFMVRGKKNFLPHSHLVYGFGFLFRLEESSISRHANERRVKTIEEDMAEAQDTVTSHALQQLSIAPTVDGSNDTAANSAAGRENDAKSRKSDDKASSNDKEINDIGNDDTIEEEDKQLNGEEVSSSSESSTESDLEIKDETQDKDDYEICVKKETSDSAPCIEFPDTVVEMTHVTGDVFALKTYTAANNENTRTPSQADTTDSMRRNKRKGVGGKQRKSSSATDVSMPTIEAEEDSNNKPLKRGQKGKLKKMKNKYKNQDEDERELRMQLLQSAGAKKEPKRTKKTKGSAKAAQTAKNITNTQPQSKPVAPVGDSTESTLLSTAVKEEGEEKVLPAVEVHDEEEEEEEEEEEGIPGLGDDLAVLSELTGQPSPDDELLYTVPVCAPYAALANYKYKVKMLPGPGKKGKACKTAVSLFLSVKPPVPREFDLLRAVRDSDLARNLPGKVKVSAPKITKVGKK